MDVEKKQEWTDGQSADETATDSQWIDGQSTVEMAMDSRRTYGQLAVETMVDSRRKNKDDRQTDRQMDEMVTDCRRINGQPAKLVN